MTITVPEPLETHDAVMDDGGIVRLRRHGNPSGPRLILVHGNGFATDAYYPFWNHFLDDYEVIIHDLRNHGQNPFSGSLGHTVVQFARDHETIGKILKERWGAKPTVGIYHSISSLAAVVQSVDRAFVWDGVVFVDPPFIPAGSHPMHEICFKFEMVLANWAMKRPDTFADPGALAQQFRDNKLMQLWIEGGHDLLARAILRRDGEVWRLSCPRELEAQIYAQNAYSDIWRRLPGLKPYADRIMFLGADGTIENAMPVTKLGPYIADEFGYAVEIVKNTTHMLQIERPDAAVHAMQPFLRRLGIVPS